MPARMRTAALRRPTAAPPAAPESPTWASHLAVCVPVGPGDESWRTALADLRPLLEAGGQLTLCGPAERPADLPTQATWVPGEQANRAAQMNAAARATTASTLWFLHADSRLAPTDLRAAADRSRTLGRAVGYLRLGFAADGPALTRLNGWAANVRSRGLGMPFGDQGLMLSRGLWEELDGFDETAPYGEGHLLVWAARRAGIPLIELPATVTTSARKYRRRGWGRTTATHLRLTLQQAGPQWWAWMRGR